MANRHFPKGPDGSWTTGQRVPITGWWKDQYDVQTFHEVGRTFPPCIARKGETAYRHLEREVVAATTLFG